MWPCAGDTILLYVLYSSILGKVKILKNIYLRTSSDQAWSYAPKLQRARSSLGSERAMEGWIHRSPTPPENDTTREERWKKRNWQQRKDWRKDRYGTTWANVFHFFIAQSYLLETCFIFQRSEHFLTNGCYSVSMLLPLAIADRHLTCNEVFIAWNKEIEWALPCYHSAKKTHN